MLLPLFPLHTVLAPGIALPLRVFEERYRVMVRRCLEASSPFGVVLIREGSEVAPASGEADLAIAGVGTFAEIREANRHADGGWDLLVVGTGRFSVLDVNADDEPYLVAEVEPIHDETGDRVAAAHLVRRVGARFIAYLRELQPREDELGMSVDVQVEIEAGEAAEGTAEAGEAAEGTAAAGGGTIADDNPVAAGDTRRGAPDGESLHVTDDPSALSFLLTGIVQVELARKQALLEAPTAERRLRDLDVLLRRELDLLNRRLGLYMPDRRDLGDRRN